jgi:hypothetical protein
MGKSPAAKFALDDSIVGVDSEVCEVFEETRFGVVLTQAHC